MSVEKGILSGAIAEIPELEPLIEVIRFCAFKGWTPATSSNFSCRTLDPVIPVVITKSGIDKTKITVDDFTAIDFEGKPLQSTVKPSAEALLHSSIYKYFPEANVILHCHTRANTLISRIHKQNQYINLSNYEILKGLRGITTHDITVPLAIFPNSQDIPTLVHQIEAYFDGLELQKAPKYPPVWGFLLESHGIYVWGNDFKEAQRHLETYEFILDCELYLINKS